jgi:hypothetical protein
MKPEQSRDNQLTVYLSVMSGTVILATQDSAQGTQCDGDFIVLFIHCYTLFVNEFINSWTYPSDMLIQKGPFLKMALSANGKILGAYTKTGDVWFVQSDFSKSVLTFETGKYAVDLLFLYFS